MWLLFTVISMVLCAAGELLIRKNASSGGENGPLAIYVSTAVFGGTAMLIMWLCGMGESGLSPWMIAVKYPVIIASVLCTFLSAYLTYTALRFIGVSLESACSGLSSVILFLGFTFINLLSGLLASANDLLMPGRLIPIIVIIVCLFFLPNTELIGQKQLSAEAYTVRMKDRKAMIVGILIMVVSSVFDAGDSLILAFAVTESGVAVTDYMLGSFFVDLIVGIGCLIALLIKAKKPYRLPKKQCLMYGLIGFLGEAAAVVYMVGSAFDAVKLAMLYITYPVLPLIGETIFMKERYTKKQYVCFGLIIAASIVFGAMDYV